MASKAAQIRISLTGATKATAEGKKVEGAIRGVRTETEKLEQAGARLGKIRSGIVSLVAPVASLSVVGTLPAITGAAAAGFVALSASIAPVVGIAAPAAAGMLAFGTAMGVARASSLGLEQSFAGMFDDFQQATPATDRLASTVRGLVPDLLALKNSVQGRVLGGLDDGLKSATPLLAAVRPQILATSSVLGDLARNAGAMMGGSFFTGAAARIMRTNVGVIENVGNGGLHAAVGLTRIVDAARPLTAWLGRLALRFGQWINVSTNAGEQSGKLAAFFDRTRVVLSRLGRIIGDVGGGLLNIFRQGAPLGDSLMVSIVRGAQAFREWTESARGKNVIGQWFQTARPVIDQTVGLIGDLAGAWGRMGMATAPTVAPMLAELRTLIPGLAAVATGIVQTFGPATVDLIVALAGAIAPIAGSGGPLLLLFQGLTLLAKGFTWLVTTIPGVSAVLSTLVGVYAVLRALTIANVVATGALTAAKIAYTRLGVIPLIASVVRHIVVQRAQAAATLAAAVATRGMTIATTALNVAMRLNPIGLVITALVALGVGFVALWKKSETFRTIVTGAWNAIKSAAGTAVSFVSGRVDALVGFFSRLPGRIGSAMKTVADILTAPYRLAFKGIATLWNNTVGKLSFKAPDWVPFGIGGKGWEAPDIPVGGLATGGVMTRPGLSWVGERGPELLSIPTGGTVFPAGPSATFAAGEARTLRASDYGALRPTAAMPRARSLVAGEDGSGMVLELTIDAPIVMDGEHVGRVQDKRRVRAQQRRGTVR